MANNGEQGSNKSVGAIESDIEVTRARLAGTIDELAFRAQPKEVARRTAESARAKFVEVTRTPEGDLRTERVGTLAAAAVALLGLATLRHRRH